MNVKISKSCMAFFKELQYCDACANFSNPYTPTNGYHELKIAGHCDFDGSEEKNLTEIQKIADKYGVKLSSSGGGWYEFKNF